MSKIKALVLLQIAFCFFLCPTVAAKLGVGVGTGKIVVDEKLKPGMLYELPELSVLNTGDEAAEYETGVAYNTNQPEIWPERGWFEFNPQSFHLEPGGVQTVKIVLSLPVNAKPGDYFAYLEGKPLKKSQAGETSVGIAAAAKLYFTVTPANLLQGLYYKALGFWTYNQPWTSIAAGVVAFLVAWRFIRKNFNIQIQRTRKSRVPERISRIKHQEDKADEDE